MSDDEKGTSMRLLLLSLMLLASGAAQAKAITFDFEYLPDSAGCSEPVSSYGASSNFALGVCNFDWVVDNSYAGIGAPYIDTEKGLTMEIGGLGNPFTFDGEYLCGNSDYCGREYIASFSEALTEAEVDFAGVGSYDSWFYSEWNPQPTFAYVLTGYSDVGGSGTVLGRTVLANIPLPSDLHAMYDFPMTLSLGNIGAFRSIGIAALGERDYEVVNLARIEAIHAHPVPEPGALALIAIPLSGFVLACRSRLRDRRVRR